MHSWTTNKTTRTHDVYSFGFESAGALEIANEFSGLAVDCVLGELDQGLDLLQQVANNAIVALCAEALGIMHKLNAATVEYSKTRKQFGMPIGSFQALQCCAIFMHSRSW